MGGEAQCMISHPPGGRYEEDIHREGLGESLHTLLSTVTEGTRWYLRWERD